MSIANIRKKKPSQTQQAIQHSMIPRYFSIPGIIAKDLGTGLIPSIFAIFYHRPPLYEEKICPVWVCSVGGTGGTTSRCQLHVVEPRAQQ